MSSGYVSVFRVVGVSPFKLIINLIQLGKQTQDGEDMQSEPSSSSTAIVVDDDSEPATIIAAQVPMSCFQVLCTFFCL